jgi:SAM-dependent methyltransferase
MCNIACYKFGEKNLSLAEIEGKKILEVGAFDVNGSLRAIVTNFNPKSYLGVDIEMGPGVDEVCNVYDLVSRFGENSFDVVVCTEMFEHVRYWRSAVTNIKKVLTENGILLLTTRSNGFGYHGYPFDFWRYEVEDMDVIFSDMVILANEKDPSEPGVFVKARKDPSYVEKDLSDIELFSIIKLQRSIDIYNSEILMWKCKRQFRKFLSSVLPSPIKSLIRKLILS